MSPPESSPSTGMTSSREKSESCHHLQEVRSVKYKLALTLYYYGTFSYDHQVPQEERVGFANWVVQLIHRLDHYLDKWFGDGVSKFSARRIALGAAVFGCLQFIMSMIAPRPKVGVATSRALWGVGVVMEGVSVVVFDSCSHACSFPLPLTT